jgi:ectoine hydroxylase-related dioxygenase (phytanoyl-CoA dioxygenase family)
MSDLRTHYAKHGFAAARGLLPKESVTALLSDIDRVLCLQSGDKVSSPQRLETEIHEKLIRLATVDRPRLGSVYDAIRKLTSFWALLGHPSLTTTAAELLGSPLVALAFRGAGIRLDLPNEDRWRSEWHQEYHSQISSPRGLVAWFSLVPTTLEMGPVEVLDGSHAEGLLPVQCGDPLNRSKDYTQTFRIPEPDRFLKKYERTRFTTEPGDLLFLDFFTVHCSGFNRSDRVRVSCQARYFDMTHPTAVDHRWVGGWQDGGDFTKLHPDKVIRDET